MIWFHLAPVPHPAYIAVGGLVPSPSCWPFSGHRPRGCGRPAVRTPARRLRVGDHAFLDDVRGGVNDKVYNAGTHSVRAPRADRCFWGAPLIARELEAGTPPARLEPVDHPDPLAGHQLAVIGVPPRPRRACSAGRSPRGAHHIDRVNANPDLALVYGARGIVRSGTHCSIRPRRHHGHADRPGPSPRWAPPSRSTSPSQSLRWTAPTSRPSRPRTAGPWIVDIHGLADLADRGLARIRGGTRLRRDVDRGGWRPSRGGPADQHAM